MVWVEIDDETLNLYKKSWMAVGVETQEKLVCLLRRYLRDSSLEVLQDAASSLFSCEAEAMTRSIESREGSNLVLERAQLIRFLKTGLFDVFRLLIYSGL